MSEEQPEGRRFVSAPYVSGDDGRYRCAGRPDRCPKAGAQERCQIKRHGRRKRKTGPEFGVEVLMCRTHEGSFSVYPPGYEPYGRQSLAPVSAAGDPMQPEPASEAGDERLEMWRGTSFRRCPRCCRGPTVDQGRHRG